MSQEDEQAIRGLIVRWDEAWNSHDAAVLASLHAPDAETINRFGLYLKGREEHKQQFVTLHEGRFKDTQWSPQQVFSLRFVRPDVAIVHTSWESPQMEREGEAIPRQDMLVSYLVTKEESGWFLASVDTHNVTGEAAQPVRMPSGASRT